MEILDTNLKNKNYTVSRLKSSINTNFAIKVDNQLFYVKTKKDALQWLKNYFTCKEMALSAEVKGNFRVYTFEDIVFFKTNNPNYKCC